jgi:hypothetical protein
MRRNQAVCRLSAFDTLLLKKMPQIVEGTLVRRDQCVLVGNTGAEFSQFGRCVSAAPLIVAMLVNMCFRNRVDTQQLGGLDRP